MNEFLYERYRNHCKARIHMHLNRKLLEHIINQRKGEQKMNAADVKIWDIHTHVIAGVDDGSLNDNMTLSMLNTLHNQKGIGIIATPHDYAFLSDPETVNKNYLKATGMVKQFFPNMRICLGCEVKCEKGKMDTVIANLNSGKFPALNNTRYVLTEFPVSVSPESMLSCVRLLLAHRWIPVIAHIERYYNLISAKDFLLNLRKLGCLFQLNISSLEPCNDRQDSHWAKMLIAYQLIDFVSSDAHDSYARKPAFSHGMQFLLASCSKEYLEKITWKNAEELIWNGASRCNGTTP